MPIRVLQITKAKELNLLFAGMKVDPYGIRIMAPKAETFLIKLEKISPVTANILKQEMLSCGGDAALPRDALTEKAGKTDCVLIATLSQLNRLKEKLLLQPFGLSQLGREIAQVLKNYRFDPAKRPLVMGIMNLTPDSFSADGLYGRDVSEIAGIAADMARDGADILDLGGESSRPGARSVSLKEELKRIIPVIKKIRRAVRVPISIDTYKPEVAKAALDNGASLVNDISGLRNPAMAKICRRYHAGIVIMHMKGNPRTMQKNPVYSDLMAEIIGYLSQAVDRALAAGLQKEKIIIDPGIGFGKTLEHNLEILKNLGELKVMGTSILVGVSRKAFIGKILKVEPGERLAGTLAACVLACANGADIVRVHDVKPVAQALKVTRGILN